MLNVPERLVYALVNWRNLLLFLCKRCDRQNGEYNVSCRN
jgi:hypothetical protein